MGMTGQNAIALLEFGEPSSPEYADALKLAIEALKAQEPVKPIIETHWETPSVYDEDIKVTENKCGACGAEIDKWDKFCRVCGKAVEWE